MQPSRNFAINKHKLEITLKVAYRYRVDHRGCISCYLGGVLGEQRLRSGRSGDGNGAPSHWTIRRHLVAVRTDHGLRCSL